MKRYMLALLAIVSFVSNTNARVSLLKYYNYQNDAETREAFDAGFDKSTDLIRGYALKLHGTAQIQRFYGNIQYVRGESEKACSYRDIGNDAVASLLVLLYPSAGPNFNSGGIGALENFFASQEDLVQIVADMLYLANRARGHLLKNSGDVGMHLESIRKLSGIIADLEKIDRANPNYDEIDKTLSDLLELSKNYADFINIQVIGEEKNLLSNQKRDGKRLYADYLGRALAIAKRAKNKIEKELFDLVFQGDDVFKNWSRSEPKVKTKLERVARAIVGSVLLERFDDNDLDRHRKDLEKYAGVLLAYRRDLEAYKIDFDANKGLKKYKGKLEVYGENLDRCRQFLDINENQFINKSDIDKAKNRLSEDEKKCDVYGKLIAYEKQLDVYKDKLDECFGLYEKALKDRPYPFGYTNDIICMYAWDVLNSDELGLLAEHLRKHKKALQKEFPGIDSCDKSFTEEMFRNYKPSIFPFSWGSIFHGTVHHRSSEGKVIEFSDCAETAMRLFCAALFAKYEDGEISLDETRIPEGELKNFFKGKDLQALSIDGRTDTRQEWIKIISGKKAYNAGILFVNDYGPADAACELKGTIGNFIWTFCWLMRGYPKLIEKELNIADISNYKAPDGTSEKDLRKINAAKRINSIVKAVEEGQSVEEKQDIVEKLAETLKQAAKIYNDLLGIRDDVQLKAINTKVENYNNFRINAKIDGIKIRDVTNHEEYFNLVTNNHAEISSPRSDNYPDSDKISIVWDPNSGFHNTLKLYKEGFSVYAKLYPWLDYCMQVVTDGDIGIGDSYIHARIMKNPLFEDYVDGVCKLLLTKDFHISGHYDEKVNEKRVKRNCNLLMRKIIENTDESNFYERLTRIVEGEYIVLRPIIFPLDLDILRTSLKYIESTVSEGDQIASGNKEKDTPENDGKASEEENLSEDDKRLAEKNRNRYEKKIRNIVKFIDLFDFTSADTDVIESLKKIAECVRKGFEKRGFAQDYLIGVKLNNKSDEKVNSLKDICRF